MGSGRTRGVTGSARWVGRVAVLLGLGCVLAAVVAPAAGANYGRIAAEVRCDRVVSWTASASAEGTDDDRTNEQVAVEYRAAGADGDWTPAGPSGSFNESNDFTFSGSFPLPEGVDAVELRVAPQVKWGADRDGAAPGAAKFATATLPAGCADQPIVATIAADCAAGGATVATRNAGDAEATVTLSADRLPVRDVTLAPGQSSSLVVPVLEGTSSAIRVNAGDFVVAQQEVAADCSLGGAAATITERCGVRQAVVLASAGADATAGDHAVEIRVSDAIVHRAEVSGDEVLKRTIELPATGAVPIQVEVDDDVVATGVVGTCDGPVTGAVACGTDGRTTCAAAVSPTTTVPAPPPPPPPLTIDLDHRALATTGPWQRAIVLFLGGVLLLGGGAALVAEQRRRPRPSLLATVVAPYRQRWWDDH